MTESQHESNADRETRGRQSTEGEGEERTHKSWEKMSKREREKDQSSSAGLLSSGSRADEMSNNRKSSFGSVVTRNVVGIFFTIHSKQAEVNPL